MNKYGCMNICIVSSLSINNKISYNKAQSMAKTIITLLKTDEKQNPKYRPKCINGKINLKKLNIFTKHKQNKYSIQICCLSKMCHSPKFAVLQNLTF